MSLYNMVAGFNSACYFFAPMLGRHPEEWGRFRDCFLYDEDFPEYDKHIHIYTRLGGGNREYHQEDIAELQSHPNYVTDHDDDFDCTYATFVFTVPEQWRADFELLIDGRGSEVSEAYKEMLFATFPKIADKLREAFASESEDA